MKGFLERFLQMSDLVGNKNIVLTKGEFERVLKDGLQKFDFVSLKCLGDFNKEIPVEKSGIKGALVEANYGIAETGTVVVESSSENFRRATSLCDELSVAVEASNIVPRLEDIADFLKNTTTRGAHFISFITGASRTADIEMSLTMGVHGPVTMVIYLIKDL